MPRSRRERRRRKKAKWQRERAAASIHTSALSGHSPHSSTTVESHSAAVSGVADTSAVISEVKMDDTAIGSDDTHEKDDSSKRSEEITAPFRKYVDCHVHLDMTVERHVRNEQKRETKRLRKSMRKAAAATDGGDASGKQKLRSGASAFLVNYLEQIPDFIQTHFGSTEDGFEFDGCVTVSCDVAQLHNVCWILDQPFAKERGIVGAFGIHPHNAKHWNPTVKRVLAEALDKYQVTGQCVAVGECGLDYFVKKGRSALLSDAALQRPAFRQQCEMALSRGMPLVVHSRNAEEDTFSILCDVFHSDEARNSQLIHVHCFTSSQWLAKQMMATFPKAFFGFTGCITFAGDALEKVVATIPLQKILLETDGPYMAPVPFRGKLAHCGHIPVIASKLAEIHGVSIDTVLRHCRENARVMYGI